MTKRILTLVISLVLVAALAVGSTLAYFSAQSETVTNTFTTAGYAADAIILDEIDYESRDLNNIPIDKLPRPGQTGGDSLPRTTANTYNGILPGTIVTKDPTVTIAKDTMDSYVIVKVEGADALTAAGMIFGKGKTDDDGNIPPVFDTDESGNIAPGFNTEYWKRVKVDGTLYTDTDTDKGLDGYYIYWSEIDKGYVVPKNSTQKNVLPSVFHYAQYDVTKTGTDAEELKKAGPLTVKGALVQAANTTPEEAVKAAVALMTTNNA